MKGKLIASTVILVVFISLAFLIVSQQPPTPWESLSTNRPPILINGNTDFDAEHGVVDGSGTISDPFVIEGWQIDASRSCPERSCTGITVQNASVSFVIRNVKIRGGLYDNGIRFSDVKNARLENVSVASGGDGISVADSTNVAIIASTFAGGDQGIFVGQSRDVWIYTNDVSHGTQGIVVKDSSRISLVDNMLNGNDANALLFSDVTNSTVEGNTITETAFRGIALFDSSDIVASRNRIVGTGEDCFYVARGGGMSILQNEVSNCTWTGILVYKSDENIVKGNLVVWTPSGISLSDSSANVVASNTVTGSRSGITVVSDSDANLILENTVSWSSSVGILLTRGDDHTPDRNVIQGNRVSQSGKADVLDSSGGTDNLWRFNTYEKEMSLTSN